MIGPRRALMGMVLLVGLLTCEGQTLGGRPQKNSILSPNEMVLINSKREETFIVALESLRTRFCTDDGGGPCYDYERLFVQVDSCGVRAFPLRKVVYFENRGEFVPNHCIRATQSSVLTTTDEEGWKVYLQERYWSIVGIEVGTGTAVELPLHELASFRQHRVNGL